MKRKIRLWSIARPWEVVCLILGIAFVAGAPRLAHATGGESISGPLFLAGLPMLLAALFTLGLRLVKLLSRLLFHRVRNRIIATYILTGVLPLLLMAVLFVSLAGAFMVQLSGNLLKQAIQREFLLLEAAALRCAFAMPAEMEEGMPDHDCFHYLGREYPGYRLAVFRGDSLFSQTTAPIPFAPGADSSRHSFLVIDETVFMAVSMSAGSNPEGRPFVLAAPIRDGLLERLERELGGACMFSYGFSASADTSEQGTGSLTIRVGTSPEGQAAGFSFSQSPEINRRVRQWLDEQPSGADFHSAYMLDLGHYIDDDGTPGEVMVLGVLHTRYSFIAGKILQGAIPGDVPLRRVFFWAAIALAGVFVSIELVALAISLVLSRSITRTIAQLHRKADCVARGDFSYRIDSKRTDQLGLLANSFDRMSDSLELLLEQMKEKERIEHELAIAQEVQRMFFPERLPRVNGVAMLGRCIPARMVSGDYYDVIQHPEGMIDFFIGDISGKGISAALLMAGSQTFLRSQAVRRPLPPVPEIVESFNNYLVQYSADGKYSTLFYGRLDPEKGVLTCCNAGHPAPFLLRGGGEVVELATGGLVPGVVPGAPYEQETVQLEKGDLMVAFTDGFTEVFDGEDQEFGEHRLLEALKAAVPLDLEAIFDHAAGIVRGWSSGPVQADDMTILMVRVE